MSYDIRYGVESRYPDLSGDSMVVIGAPEYDSPTYNLREMFVACMDWDYKQGFWYPMAEVLPKIERGVRELTEHRERYLRYNPPNGWGSLDGALECLRNWHQELADPDFWGVTRDWPIEHLWWRW